MIFGRELRIPGLWTGMMKRSLKCLERVCGETKLPSIIPASAELEKGIQGNRQRDQTIQLYAINEVRPIEKIFCRMLPVTIYLKETGLPGSGVLPASTPLLWASALPALSTVLNGPIRIKCHAQLPSTHCLLASLCSYSQVCKLAALHLHLSLHTWLLTSFFRFP